MHQILAFEADRRTINITINSFNTELSKEQRAKLFPSIGNLFPAGNNNLAKSDDLDQVKQVCDSVGAYRSFFDPAPGGASSNANGGGLDDELSIASRLEERFFSLEVHFNKLSFLSQFQYGVFYGYFKLKEQEIRNLMWIAECIAQDAKDRMQDYITIF
jgi:V-type H+-transporting ATPase subunit d